MSQVLLSSFQHQPGLHCGSTALADAARFRGLHLSEPLCFGLGRGLSLFVYSYPSLTPPQGIALRALHLEANFFQALGAPFQWRRAESVEDGLKELEAALQQGNPPIVQVELSALPYYQTTTRFPGHLVLVARLSREQGTISLADTHFEELQEISLQDFARAWLAPQPPIPLFCHFYPVPPLNQAPLSITPVRHAIQKQAEEMLQGGEFPGGIFGLRAFSRLRRDLPHWRKSENGSFCYRFAYQTIEKRGTGGGGFRRLYTLFLKEVVQRFPELGQDLVGAMEKIAESWKDAAALFKRLSEAYSRQDERELLTLLTSLESQEQAFYKRALTL